jgi:hypothetical protein
MEKKTTWPCLGGELNVFCISPRMVTNWITQWSFQWPAFLTRSTSSFVLSNSTISTFFRGIFLLLVRCWLLYNAFNWRSLLITFCEVDRHRRGDLRGRCEAAYYGWRHEGMGKYKRHLIPHSGEALEIWYIGNVGPYCTKFVDRSEKRSICRDIWVAATRIS